MPYSRNSDLPKAVRQTVPEEKHTQFRRVFNSVYDDTKNEQRAFQAAWSAVGKLDIKLFLRKEQALLRIEQAEKQKQFLKQLRLDKQIEKFRIREIVSRQLRRRSQLRSFTA